MNRSANARRIRALLGGLTLALGLVANAPAQQPVKLRMTIWSANEAHRKLFNGIADDYKRVKPNVAVSFDSLPFPNYTTALTTQIAGGNAPAMAWIFETTAQDFVNPGALFPLTKTLAAAPSYILGE